MVELVVSDVDGVLTDGRINIGSGGELYKSFNVKDGLGIARWLESGREFVIVTSRESKALEHRAGELGIEEIHQGVSDKKRKVEQIAKSRGIELDRIAYIGDDDTDIAALEEVGIGCCPADASRTVRRVSQMVSSQRGGRGAARDILDRLRGQLGSVLGVIPARYGSTRLPGKPLVELCSKPMIQHVHERAMAASELDNVIVATDDERIVDAVESFGGNVVMTDEDHPSGTDRVAEAARDADYEITVNIQGDEPLIDPEVIDTTVRSLKNNPPRMSTPITLIRDDESLTDPNTVKVVQAEDGRALYFSRSKIPSGGDVEETYKHIGLYAFETELLLEYVDLKSKLEPMEDLEQLRLLENGHDIQTVPVKYDPKEVNVERDVKMVEEILAKP